MSNSKQMVTSYMEEVWVKQNIDKVDEFIADDLIQHNPNLPNGKEALKGFLPTLFNDLMPNLEWTVARVIAEGDLVAVHSLAKNPAMPNGMAVVDIFKVEGDKIVEHWDVTHNVPEKTASGNPMV